MTRERLARVDDLLNDACARLRAPRVSIPAALTGTGVPESAGLYAIYGKAETWQQLGLEPFDERPLYVGKAETSLRARDVNTHFSAGCTGQSTLRRTLAALLRSKLNLRGVPRNQQDPERPTHFALNEKHDAALNAWMHEHLEIAVWAKPDSVSDLGTIEVAVLTTWSPPLNIKDNPSPWRSKVSEARKAMAKDVVAWATDRGLTIKTRSRTRR